MDIILKQSDYKNVNICRHVSANYVLSPGKVILGGIGMKPGFVIPKCWSLPLFPNCMHFP